MQKIRFNELPITDKALLIAEFGKYLESIDLHSNYWVHLYALNSHFIEIHYNINTRQIDKITLIDYSELDKYLSKVVLKGINIKK